MKIILDGLDNVIVETAKLKKLCKIANDLTEKKEYYNCDFYLDDESKTCCTFLALKTNAGVTDKGSKRVYHMFRVFLPLVNIKGRKEKYNPTWFALDVLNENIIKLAVPLPSSKNAEFNDKLDFVLKQLSLSE